MKAIRLIPNSHMLHFGLAKEKKFINPCSSTDEHIYFPIKKFFKIMLLIIGTFCGWKRDVSEMFSSHCKVHIAKYVMIDLFIETYYINCIPKF